MTVVYQIAYQDPHAAMSDDSGPKHVGFVGSFEDATTYVYGKCAKSLVRHRGNIWSSNQFSNNVGYIVTMHDVHDAKSLAQSDTDAIMRRAIAKLSEVERKVLGL